MEYELSLTTLAVVSLVILSMFSSPSIQPASASPASTPWPMFHQNAQHTGLSRFAGPTVPSLKWKFQTGGVILSSPATGFGRIYVGSTDGNLYALNNQGSLLWKFQIGCPIYTTPAIASDGTIYVGGCVTEQHKSVLYAINSAGKLKWSIAIEAPEGGSLNSPTIGTDGTIYVSELGFAIAAVNPDGTLKWDVATGGEVFDPPTLSNDGTLYSGIDDPDTSGVCGECFLALNPNGTVKWSLAGGSGGFSTPAVGSDGTIYTDGFAFNPDGTIKWQGGAFYSPSIGRDGTIYGSVAGYYNYGLEGGIFAYNPHGTLQWRFATEPSRTSCITADCSIVSNVGVQQSSAAIGSDGVVYFGYGITRSLDECSNGGCQLVSRNGTGTLFALHPNGTLAWNFPTGSTVGQTFAVSDPAIGLDRTIYVGGTDGILYAIGQA